MEVQRIWKIAGQRPLNPAHIAATATEAGWPMDWFGRVNALSCPRGRPWGEVHFLVSQETLGALALDAAIDVTCEHEDGTTTWAGYYCIRTQSITQDPDNSAHWITLADRRWILEQSTVEDNRYNLRSAPDTFHDSTTNGGTAWTWAEIFADLWALLPGVAGTAPTLPITPGSTPENLVFDGLSAWHAINQLLTAIGCCACYDPLTAVFSVVEAKATQSGLADQRTDDRDRLLWTYLPQELNPTNYPDKVAVTFHLFPDGSLSPFPATPIIEEASLAQNGIAGTKYPIVDTMFATADNAADLTTRAGEIKDALVGLLRPMAKPWGEVYSGVREFEIGSELTEVIWSSDGYRGMRTICKYSRQEIDWPELRFDAGVGFTRIEFIITAATTVDDEESPYDGMRELTVDVQSPSCNNPALLGATGIKVYEHIPLCLTGDESDAALVDRKGTAYEGLWDGAPCHFVLDGLCCPE